MKSHSITGLVALLASASQLASVTAFSIDRASCQGDQFDYMLRAVAEARNMVLAGKASILAPQTGNSREKIWNTDDPTNLQRVDGKLIISFQKYAIANVSGW